MLTQGHSASRNALRLIFDDTEIALELADGATLLDVADISAWIAERHHRLPGAIKVVLRAHPGAAYEGSPS